MCSDTVNVTPNTLTRAWKVAYIESSLCFLRYTKAHTLLSNIVKYDIYIYNYIYNVSACYDDN